MLVPYHVTFPTVLETLRSSLYDEFWQSPAFLFERNWKPTEIKSTDKEYVIEIELPRFKKEDVKVESIDGSIVVTAKNAKSSFVRAFSYSDWDSENSNVELKDGLLTITVARVSPKIKTLEIK